MYKVKYLSDGTVDKYKVRLVAKGYTQQAGLDFIKTFSPVAKVSTIQLLLALAIVHNLLLLQLDINNVFSNGSLTEQIYMDLPLGYPNRGSVSLASSTSPFIGFIKLLVSGSPHSLRP